MPPSAAVQSEDPEDLLTGYRTVEGIYDELVAPEGQRRGYWQGFLDGMRALSTPRPRSA